MFETLNHCPICAGSKFEPYLTCQDYTVSQEKFSIVSCQNCNFRFTNPRPSEAESGQYYQSENYISHSNTRKGLINQVYQIVRQRALKAKLKLIESLSSENSPFGGRGAKEILDYGCGTGAFLNVCKMAGWQVAGLEPDSGARKQAEELTNIKIENDIFSQVFDNQQFDVITLWHVLEHVHRLDETLARLKTLLKPEGTILIAVPNSDSQDAQTFRAHWAAYDVPRHLYHFTPETMPQLLAKQQLKIQTYLPMYYDAYYISLLSEKYQKGKVNYLSAFLKGWKSNTWAKKNKNNYSSVIYVVKSL